MGYVGIRWLKVMALPTPEHLRRAVSLAPFLDRKYSVVGAQAATTEEIVEEYRRFLEGSRTLFQFVFATKASDVSRRTCADGRQTYLERETPVVGTRFDDLYFREPDVLSATCTGTPAFLSFHFPAAYSPPPHDGIATTDGYPNRELYEAMRGELLQGSKPLVVVGPSREWRLPVRVDQEMRDWIAEHPVLKNNGLRLK